LAATGEDSLCLSGGTFLNCLANAAIATSPRISRMFIPSATGDDGTAMGAALYAYGKPTGGFTPYTGPEYGADEVRSALNRPAAPDRRPFVWRYHGHSDEYVDLAATDLADDRIVAWFAGRMEYGPRALGNRSILALPSGTDIKDRLNRVVKLRESFRPFAPAILDTDYELAFVGRPLQPARYMLTIAEVRPEFRSRLAGAVHLDGTARVQIVSREDNELFWRLLRAVKRHTGLGCVINTSFNVKDQPIIMTPDLALDAFQTMSLDRLYIEGYRVAEPEPAPTGR
jgi:carbamoyltransferase